MTCGKILSWGFPDQIPGTAPVNICFIFFLRWKQFPATCSITKEHLKDKIIFKPAMHETFVTKTLTADWLYPVVSLPRSGVSELPGGGSALPGEGSAVIQTPLRRQTTPPSPSECRSPSEGRPPKRADPSDHVTSDACWEKVDPPHCGQNDRRLWKHYLLPYFICGR